MSGPRPGDKRETGSSMSAADAPLKPAEPEAPLTIEGFRYERKLGSFPLGDSYQYLQIQEKRRVHVLLGHQIAPLDTFLGQFRSLIGDLADGLLLYAGLTDKDRPYLVTTFLDETTPNGAEVDDEQQLSSPDSLSDDTRLSIRKDNLDDTVVVDRTESDDLTLLVTRSVQPQHLETNSKQAPSTRKTRPTAKPIPTLVVSEREARIPDPSAPATSLHYTPRSLPHAPAHPEIIASPAGPLTTSAPVSRARREQRRARLALGVLGMSIAVSILGVIGILLWLVTS